MRKITAIAGFLYSVCFVNATAQGLQQTPSLIADAGEDKEVCASGIAVFAKGFTKVYKGALVTEGANDWSATWGDYDGDGDLDVFLFAVSTSSSNPDALNILLRNDCNNSFTKIINTPPAALAGASAASSWIDVDNDGDLDLFILQANSTLFINDGTGNFSAMDVHLDIGSEYASNGSFADYDGNGFTDVLISTEHKNYLFSNNGSLSFTPIDAGSLCSPAYITCNAWGDYDNDGKPDVVKLGGRYTGSDEVNLLYHNEGNGNFTPVPLFPLTSLNYGAYGASWIDYDNDQDLDLFIENAFSSSLLFNNDGHGDFTRVMSAPGGSHLGQGGSVWGDYDNDGDLDMFLPNANFVSNELYTNIGDGTFLKNTSEPMVTEPATSESIGANWVDTDNDGDLDLYVTNGFDNTNGPNNYFYHNNGNSNTWLKIRLDGAQSNRQGIGARVFARAIINGKSVTQMREVNANSHLGGGGNGVFSAELHFGFADATLIDELKVVWPTSGITQTFNNVQGFQTLKITENSNSPTLLTSCNPSPRNAIGGTPTASGGTPPYTYSWMPVEGLSDPFISNPVALPDVTTNYTLTVTDAGGLSNTDEVRVSISSTFSANAGADASMCEGEKIILGGNPTSNGCASSLTYFWSPSTGLSTDDVANPLASPEESTTYTLTIKNNVGVISTDMIAVSVHDLPALMVSGNSTICKGETTPLHATGNGSFKWYPAQGLDNPNSSDPMASPLISTNYNVLITDEFNCNSRQPLGVIVNSIPQIITSKDVVICKGETAQLQAHADVSPVLWSPVIGLDNPASPFPNASPLVTTTYTITAGSTPCIAQKTVAVTVQENANAQYNYTFPGLQVQFAPVNVLSSSYKWIFGDGGFSSLVNPSHTYSQEGNYNVCLSVASACGNTNYCNTVIVKNIKNVCCGMGN